MQTKTLGEICRPKQWKTVATSQLSEEGYPVYGANGIIGKYKEYNHENETILVTCRGATCGALNICEPFSYVNGNAMALDNLDQSIDLKYLYYFLKGRGFHDVISGSAQPQIIRSAIERIEVPICDIETQKEITKSFAKIEKLIESKKKILANLDNLVKARFVEMFKGKYDSFKVGEKLKTTSGGTPKSSISDYYDGGDIPWLTSGEVNYGDITKPSNFITEKGLNNSSAKWVPENSIVIAMYGATAGKVGIVRYKTTTNQAVCSVLPNDNFNQEFLRYAFQDISEELTSKAIGGGQPNISQTIIKNSYIVDAPIEEQERFASFAKQVDKSKFALGNELAMGNFYIRLIYDRIMHGCIDL